MRIIGLTGGIGCGKSTVTSYLSSLSGFEVIDFDKISRTVVQPGWPAYKKIIECFGREILLKDSEELDRKKLGEKVFKDKAKLKILTGITGPAIFKELMKQLSYHFLIGTPIVVLDAPTLYETKKLLKICACVVVVGCEEKIQVERVMKRDGLEEHLVRDRMSNQIPVKEKAEMADFVIWNNGGKDETMEKVDRLAASLKKRYTGISLLLSAPGILLPIGIILVLSKYLL